MDAARGWIQDRYPGWDIADHTKGNPYDYLISFGMETKFVEVKGTTGSEVNVIVTRGEVLHAELHPKDTILVVITGIVLDKNPPVTASQGTITFFDPWCPANEELRPISFKFTPGVANPGMRH